MPDVETVRGVVRSELGAMSRLLTGECRMLARLLADDEHEGSLSALAEELGPDEAVVDLALWTGAPGGIVAVCDARLVVIPDKGRGSDAPISLSCDAIVEIRAEGFDLVARTADAEHRFAELGPADRAGVIAARVGARVGRA